ncbi:MAG: hypothetical protein R2695_01540 [Acidimicrobiales bacterium]
MAHLLRLRQVGHELGGNPQLMGDDPGDVDGIVADPLDRADHLEHRRHPLCFLGSPHRHDADLTHVLDEVVHLLLELADLLGHVGVAEEQRGVGEVDHQLGHVLRLGQHLAEIAGVCRPSVAFHYRTLRHVSSPVM